MELRHLRYFVAVAEELHFGRAARRLHIAQPPLSQQIKQFEEELGAELFLRTKRSVELTYAGSILLPRARAIISQAEQCVTLLRDVAGGTIGRLRIGYVDEAVHFVFPDLINAFKRQYPDVEIVLTEMHSQQQVDALLDGSIDFGLGYVRATTDKIQVQPLLSGKMLLALPQDNRLCAKKQLRLRDCAGQPFIFPVRQTSPALHDQMLSLCNDDGLVPDIRYTAEHIYTVMGLVRAELGITLFPEFLRENEWHGVEFRPIKGSNMELTLYLSWNAKRCDTPVHRNFLEVASSFPNGIK